MFEMGAQPFEQFCNDFHLSADQSGFDPPAVGHPEYDDICKRRGYCLKGLFYQCLSTEAKALAGRRLYPTGVECEKMTLKEYIDKLRLLFEPPSESETARHEFLDRSQNKDENPMLYLSDKITLFERAFAAPKRDFNLLFDSATDGLFNETLRKEMRKVMSSNEEQYSQHLAFHINAIRKSVLAGDLAEADAKGTMTYSTTSSYLAHKSGAQRTTIKSEPGVYSLNRRGDTGANTGKTGNAKKLRIRCYHCQKTGHFARECTRKLAGLPPVKREFNKVIAVIEAESDSTDDEVANTIAEINAMKEAPRRVRFKGKERKGRSPPRRRSVQEMTASEATEDDERYEQCVSNAEVSHVDEPDTDEHASVNTGSSRPEPPSGGAMRTPAAARSGVYSMNDVDILDALEDGVSFLDL